LSICIFFYAGHFARKNEIDKNLIFLLPLDGVVMMMLESLIAFVDEVK
jgi:hypothetical protein